MHDLNRNGFFPSNSTIAITIKITYLNVFQNTYVFIKICHTIICTGTWKVIRRRQGVQSIYVHRTQHALLTLECHTVYSQFVAHFRSPLFEFLFLFGLGICTMLPTVVHCAYGIGKIAPVMKDVIKRSGSMSLYTNGGKKLNHSFKQLYIHKIFFSILVCKYFEWEWIGRLALFSRICSQLSNWKINGAKNEKKSANEYLWENNVYLSIIADEKNTITTHKYANKMIK